MRRSLDGLVRAAIRAHHGASLQTRSFSSVSSTGSVSSPSSSTPSSQSSQTIKDVPGLSKRIVDIPSGEVGPGASKQGVYKNPEYYCYHNMTYFEAEVEMKSYRLPQPSALQK